MNLIYLMEQNPYCPIIKTNDYVDIPNNYAEFPDDFIDIFYPKDKRCGGFVHIYVENNVVKSCEWDEQQYEQWCVENPETEAFVIDESDIVLHASDLANAIRSGVNDTL